MIGLTKSTKTIKKKNVKRNWHLFDVKDKVLGREITKISSYLQGKTKSDYSPNADCGDYVVVLNASKVRVTGKKATDKIYTNYSGYPGGLTKITFEKLIIKRPSEVIRRGVSGMLPKNKLRDRRLARLFVFKDELNPYSDKFKNKDA